MTTFEKMPCSNTESCKNHDVKDAPEFSEAEYRAEAEAIVLKSLIDDPIETLDRFTGIDGFEIALGRLTKLIRGDGDLMNMLFSGCQDVCKDEIQEKLEQEN